MSISGAINAALTGLKASQTQSAIVARNVANAQTPGYVRKEVSLSSLTIGGVGQGVKIDGIVRKVDELLIRDVRQASGTQARQQVLAEALAKYTDIVGQPQDERSLASAIGRLQTQLAQLGANPESPTVQQAVVSAAEDVVRSLAAADQGIRLAREDADAGIGESVETVNSSLLRLEEINRQLSANGGGGNDLSDLADERDRLLDVLSQEIGIRTFFRDSGEVVVLTDGGTTLLDGEASLLAFESSLNIPADLRYDPLVPGGLSGITVDGIDIAPGSGYAGAIGSGRLAGYFELRDNTMVRFQTQMDEAASRLAEAFQSADATVTGTPPQDTGLFTDGGVAHSGTPSYVAGLAGRLQVNDLVKPEAGGDLWRLRTGMHAAGAGLPGEVGQVRAFEDIFTSDYAFAASAGLMTTAKLGGFAAAAVSDQHGTRSRAEIGLQAADVTLGTLGTARENRDGVNVDDEMQKLLSLEKSYAASAQVLSVANRMLDRLFEI